MKKILLRGAAIGLIAVLIMCVGGITKLDLITCIIIGLLVLILASLVVIIHNQKGE